MEKELLIKQIDVFHSPTYGEITLPKILKRITNFAHAEPDYRYRIIIGTDSQTRNGKTDFVTALIVHRIGGGGIYFWKRWSKTHPSADKNKGKTSEGRQTSIFGNSGTLRWRIYEEAIASLDFANEFLHLLKGTPELLQFDLEIHVDIGERGKTREMIAEVVAMIQGNGYRVKTKPDAYGASSVADRHA